jgi:hypothetical protein
MFATIPSSNVGKPRLEIEIKSTGERKMMHDIDDSKESNFTLYGNDWEALEKIPYREARIIMDGWIPKDCLALVKSNQRIAGKDENGKYIWEYDERFAGITGKPSFGSGYTAHYMQGSTGIVGKDDIIKILDRDFFLHSPIWLNAEFYESWSKEQRVICPTCKGVWFYPSRLVSSWGCQHCKEGWKAEDEFKHVELTDEMIVNHNAKVIMNNFKRLFENTVSTTEKQKWFREKACENLMSTGAEIKDFYNYLSKEQLNELREDFKVAYGKVLRIVKGE